MNEYFVTADAFYDKPDGLKVPFTRFKDFVEQCKAPMQGLVQRYGLAGKPVFSLGAGATFEEWWFADANCALTLLDTDATVSSLRGRVHDYRGVPLIVTYHPAYLLRNLTDKVRAWEDLLFARRTFDALQ